MLKLNAQQQELYKTELVEKNYPEYYLIKVKNFDDVAKDGLDEWIYFLKNEEIKDDFKAKGLDKARETLDYLKINVSEKQYYDQFKMDLHHQASLYESTYVIGKLETARICKKKGFSTEDISQITGMSKKEIDGL